MQVHRYSFQAQDAESEAIVGAEVVHREVDVRDGAVEQGSRKFGVRMSHQGGRCASLPERSAELHEIHLNENCLGWERVKEGSIFLLSSSGSRVIPHK